MSRETVLSPENKQREEFIAGLREVVEVLEQFKLEYVFVGGIPLRAYLCKDVQYRRDNGTVPDLDILLLGITKDQVEKVKFVENFFNKRKRVCPNYPQVGLEMVPKVQGKKRKLPILRRYKEVYTQMVNGMYMDRDGEYHLFYKFTDKKIRKETCKPITVDYGGVPIKTFHPVTILYRYFLRGPLADLKPKDREKVMELYNLLNDRGLLRPDIMDLYRDYRTFSVLLRTGHRTAGVFFNAFWHVDKFLGGMISGPKDLFYKILPMFQP